MTSWKLPDGYTAGERDYDVAQAVCGTAENFCYTIACMSAAIVWAVYSPWLSLPAGIGAYLLGMHGPKRALRQAEDKWQRDKASYEDWEQQRHA